MVFVAPKRDWKGLLSGYCGIFCFFFYQLNVRKKDVQDKLAIVQIWKY